MKTIMWYEWKIINKMFDSDIWRYVYYIDVIKWIEKWRIKRFDNEKQIAYVVFKCNNDWGTYKDYTAEACDYNNLEF